jgi:predicted O-linked N-acetylglucosamine transferase (SPINDLY family)
MPDMGELLAGALDLHRRGDLEKAAERYRSILKKDPGNCDCLHMLGVVLCQKGMPDEGIELISRAVALNPSVPGFHSNLANALLEAGKPGEALSESMTAIRLQPDYADAHYIAGICLTRLGRREQAMESYRKAIGFKPGMARAHNNLGILLLEQEDFNSAFACYSRAIEADPAYAEAYNNLGNLQKNAGRPFESISSFQKAIDLRKDYADAYTNLGGALKDLGRIEDALACDRTARDLNPDSQVYWSNYLLTLHYSADVNAQELFDAHADWGAVMAPRLMEGAYADHENDPDPGRRLRIGYVSGDFKTHSVAYFIEPVLENHDASRFEVSCYADVTKSDETTSRLMKLAKGSWRDVSHLDAQEIAERIRQDRIDILVDLAGHTGRKQMQIFALKPAPIQVTYLGYPDTTGLPAMDYRITDAQADPPGISDRLNTETLIRLDRGFLCYRPPLEAPEVGVLPFLENGFITFGSFNHRAKINRNVVQVWSEILKALPSSRLVIKSVSLGDGQTRADLVNLFVQAGVKPERIIPHGFSKAVADHFGLYNSIDIGLDTFPYNGTTTTCEALWMGVPVITLEGGSHHSRVGRSILHHAGLARFVAASPIDYVDKAVHLARGRELLVSLRAGMRTMLKGSPLLDVRGFTSALESEYRKIWRRWCGSDQRADEGETERLRQDVTSILVQGEDLFSAGEIEQAEKLFRQVLDLDANSTAALNDMGVLCWTTGRVRQAIDYFRQALRIDPSFEDARLNLDEILKQTPGSS